MWRDFEKFNGKVTCKFKFGTFGFGDKNKILNAAKKQPLQ